MLKRLGVYGGTFDPIHMGHLIVAEMARYECGLHKVLFIPAKIPPHKDDAYITPPDYRFEMVSLAIESNPAFEISDMELKRKGISYTIDTLKILKEQYSNKNEIWMIIGADSFMEIEGWKDFGEITKICNFAVYSRPNFTMDVLRAKAETMIKVSNVNIRFIKAPMIDISSTEIRTRLNQGKSIRYMVPDSVEKYIMDKELFVRT